MSESAADRLRKARIAMRFQSATDAARAFGWNENTYRSHENGERGLRESAAKKYARAFRVNLAWLLIGDGDQKAKNIVSIEANIDKDSKLIWEKVQNNFGIIQAAELSFEVPDDNVQGFIINTDALYPRYEKFDLLLTWPFNVEQHGPMFPTEYILAASNGDRYLGAYSGDHLFRPNRPPLQLDFLHDYDWKIEVVVRAGSWVPLYRTQHDDQDEQVDDLIQKKLGLF